MINFIDYQISSIGQAGCCEYGTIKTDYRLRQTHRQNQEKLVKKRSRHFKHIKACLMT